MNPQNQRTNLLGLALLLALVGQSVQDPLVAYGKKEHEVLTKRVLEVVVALECDGQGFSGPRSSATNPLCEAIASFDDGELAFLTRSVDYFTHPERLAPDPSTCKPGVKPEPCRRKVTLACSDPQQDCAQAAIDNTRSLAARRKKNRLYRALAVHRNVGHFRAGAGDLYTNVHSRAVELARNGEYQLALMAEAVALHFLQDGFSPGHLAAPRDEYGDALAGVLHDRFNRKGLPVVPGSRLCQIASTVVDQKAQDIVKQVGLTKRATAIDDENLVEDLELLLDQHCESCPRGKPCDSYVALGDKQIFGPRADRLCEGKEPCRALQRAILTLAGVASMQELFDSHSKKDALALCYHPPLKDRDEGNNRMGRFSGPPKGIWAPGLALGWIEEATKNHPCWHGQTDGELLLAYGTDEIGQHPLSSQWNWVGSYQIGFSTWGESRKRWEVAADLLATQAFALWSGEGPIERDERMNYYGSIGTALHYEEVDNLDIIGAGVLYSYNFKTLNKHRDFDVYVALEPGLGYHSFNGDHSLKFRGSARVGVGLGFAFLEGIAERGFEERDGRLDQEWRYSLNFRLRFAPTWFQFLGGRD